MSLSNFYSISSVAFILYISCMNIICYQYLSMAFVIVFLCFMGDYSYNGEQPMEPSSHFQSNIPAVPLTHCVIIDNFPEPVSLSVK